MVVQARGPVASLLAAIVLAACGSDRTPSSGGPQQQGVPSRSASPTPAGFLDFPYVEVERTTCDDLVRLGDRSKVTFTTPDKVGAAPFVPRCLTGVRATELEITLHNTSKMGLVHNIIVEGNESELLVQPGEKATERFELAKDDRQINFQCTIHDPMYGAFFR